MVGGGGGEGRGERWSGVGLGGGVAGGQGVCDRRWV